MLTFLTPCRWWSSRDVDCSHFPVYLGFARTLLESDSPPQIYFASLVIAFLPRYAFLDANALPTIKLLIRKAFPVQGPALKYPSKTCYDWIFGRLWFDYEELAEFILVRIAKVAFDPTTGRLKESYLPETGSRWLICKCIRVLFQHPEKSFVRIATESTARLPPRPWAILFAPVLADRFVETKVKNGVELRTLIEGMVPDDEYVAEGVLSLMREQAIDDSIAVAVFADPNYIFDRHPTVELFWSLVQNKVITQDRFNEHRDDCDGLKKES
jgi:hypothetical protein